MKKFLTIVVKDIRLLLRDPVVLVQDHPGCSNFEDVFIQLTGRHMRDD